MTPPRSEPANQRLRRPQQARALETRARLLRSGRRAFAAQGHDGVSLADDILAPAGVSVGSFYHQFNDKTDLLLAILNEAAAQRRSQVLAPPAPGAPADAATFIRGALMRYFDSLDEDGDGWRLQFHSRTSNDPRVRRVIQLGRRRWVSDVASSLADWSQRSPAACEPIAVVLTATASGLGVHYLDLPADQRATQRDDLIDVSVGVLTDGVRALLGDGGRE